MEEFYINQAGSGIPINIYSGLRYQKGHGFFGRLISKTIFPLLKYVGKQSLDTGKNIMSDILYGKNVVDSAKDRISDTFNQISSDIRNKKWQSGNGIRKKSKTKKKKKPKLIKRVSSIKNKIKKKKSRTSKKKFKKKPSDKSIDLF